MTTPILEARDLSKRFPGPKKLFTPARFVTAVDRVSLSVMPGETLAIVGESGSGKSTLGRLLLRLLAASEGRVFYQGEEITHASGARLNQLRRELQIIFQDPFASLNPRMTVEQIVGEPLWLHQEMKKADRHYRVAELLKTVGLPAAWAARFPHEFSGGQRQRIGIARALASGPKLLLGDEPPPRRKPEGNSLEPTHPQAPEGSTGGTALAAAHASAQMAFISSPAGSSQSL